MKYIGIFFAIVLGAVLTVGAIGFYLLSDTGSAPGGGTQQLPRAAANGGLALPTDPNGGGSGYVVEGALSIPDSLRKVLETKKDARVAVDAYLNAPIISQRIGEYEGPVNLSQGPVKYFVRVSGNWPNQLALRESIPLFVQATICYDRPASDHCLRKWTGTAMFGTILLKARLQGDKGKQVKIDVPNVVLTSYPAPISSADCRSSGGTISGSIQPTQAFLSGPARATKKMVLLATPRSGTALPSPYGVGPDPHPLRKEELDKMGDAGVVRQEISLNGASAVPFSVKVPDKFQDSHYDLYLAACRDGQPADDCAAQAFPIDPLQAAVDQSRGLYKLVRSGFTFAACGTKGQTFYLHNWTGGAWPTDASVSKASPPEIIEGAMY